MDSGARTRCGRFLPGGAQAFVLAVLALAATPPAEAQNLAANGHFHTDTVGWDLVYGGSLLWTDLTEEGNCPGSGSALIPSVLVNGSQVAEIAQCIVVHDEPNLFVNVRHQGYGTFRIQMQYYTTTNCSAGALTLATTTEAQSPVAWDDLVLSAVPPGNANGLQIFLAAIDSAAHGLSVDEVTVSSRWPIFLDGFEGADGESPPCRWIASP